MTANKLPPAAWREQIKMFTSFIAAAAARGLVVENVVADGKRHRVRVEGKPWKELHGWYVFRIEDGLAQAVFGRLDDGLPDGEWSNDV